jgi:hypothetical protein
MEGCRLAEDTAEAAQSVYYSVWLRAGRLGDRGSIPAEAKGFFL